MPHDSHQRLPAKSETELAPSHGQGLPQGPMVVRPSR